MPTKVDYLDEAWNLVVGCSKVSTGCESCFAARDAAARLKHLPTYQGLAYLDKHGRPQWTGEVRCLLDKLEKPLHWRKPRQVGVAFTGDLFNSEVPTGFIEQVFDVMERCPQHRFLVLTKRPDRAAIILRARNRSLPPPANIWLGTSIENQEEADYRIPIIVNMKIARRWVNIWVSIEPCLEPVSLVPWLGRIGWVVLGCESGPSARPMRLEWVRSLRDQILACGEDRPAFYFKQAIIGRRLVHSPPLDGQLWLEMPGGGA